MMKTGKPALQGAKASGSSAESSLAYPNSSLKVSPAPQSSQGKSKHNRFKIIASILKQSCSSASPRPPEVFHGLPNGLVVSEESSSKKSSHKRNPPKDDIDFGLFQTRHWGSSEATSGAGEIPREMYTLSEEAGGPEVSDAEQRDREQKDIGERGLPLTEREEETAVNEAKEENSEVINTNSSTDEGGKI